jgi:putative ABC transport system permease protein
MIKFAPIVWRNLLRNKLRSLLTGGAIMLAIALVCVLRTAPEGFDAFLKALAKNSRISIHNTAGIVYSMPYAYLSRVRAVPGVVDAVSWSWFGGAVDVDEGVAFPNFAVDAETIGVVFEDLGMEPAAVEHFRTHRDGALVGRMTMKRFGWQPGDEVTLTSTVYPLTLTFRISGEIPADQDPRFWLQRAYLEEALKAQGIASDQIGMIWARIDQAERVPAVMKQIDDMFRNSEAETESETEKSFFQNFFSILQGIIAVFLIVSWLVTGCIVFIAANTASMAVRERLRELAVLKAIGYRWRLLFGTLLAEATLLSTLAGASGALLSLGFTRVLGTLASTTPQMGPLSGFVVTNWILVQALFIAFFVGILSGVVPSFGAARRSVAATLREVF